MTGKRGTVIEIGGTVTEVESNLHAVQQVLPAPDISQKTEKKILAERVHHPKKI